MGKQKQQVISRFFATKPNHKDPGPSTSTSKPPPTTALTPPKISGTASFSPAKRLRATHLFPKNKLRKLSVSSENSSQVSTTINKPSLSLELSPHTHDPTLHEKFLSRLFEVDQECSEHYRNISNDNNLKYTPLEQQVVELKAKYPDVLLMVEVGYKYRFFGEDAENAARVLGIFAHMDHNFLTASIPTFRLNVHVRRLVSAGYKVGVVKQTETAAIKGHGSNKFAPFSRGLSALYTKATLEAAESMGVGEDGCGPCNNYLICIVEKEVNNLEQGIGSGVDVRIGVVGVEVSTGDVLFGEFNDNFMRESLEAVILNLSPAELLLGMPLSKQTEKLLLAYAGPASNVRVEHTSRDCFNDNEALAEVTSVYQNLSASSSSEVHQDEDGRPIGNWNNDLAIHGIVSMPGMAVEALALIIRHLKQFGLERILCLGASFRPFSGNMEMTLSANALQQLEVLKNNSDGTESGSLLACMNNTITIFGSRLLRHWVTHPLCDQEMINARLDAVSEIAESMGLTNSSLRSAFHRGESCVTNVQPELHHSITSVLISLGRSLDIQRGITRIFHQTATASEFIAVIEAILLAGKQLQHLSDENKFNIKNMKSGTVRCELLRKLILAVTSSGVISTSAELLSALSKEAADQRNLHNLFIVSDGKFMEVAEARKKVEAANEKLNLLLSEYRKQLHMRSLEFTSVSGAMYLIELPSSVRVPNNWVKVNSTKKAIRYHTTEVLAALDHLSLANEELTLVCRAAWGTFLKEFGVHFPEFQAAVQALATLDCLHSLAVLSRNKNYVRPDFVCNDEPVQIDICSGRHPILENLLQDNFVANDTSLHAEREYCQIVTGPNMGGKSCYIRQVALITMMAQIGSFVPASSARLHVVDGIFTRMGASDNIHQGISTFLEELSEASSILKNCTHRSLVIIDELGRGTSTHDGVAIAYATLQYLLEQKRCMVLFVTHYPKIADIKNLFPGSVGTYHVSYLSPEIKDVSEMSTVNNEDVTYLYKLVPGVAERSFGFKVAKLAQLPASCVELAISMSAVLEAAVAKRRKNNLLIGYSKEPLLNAEHGDSKEDSFGNCYSTAEGLEKFAGAFQEILLDLNSVLLDRFDDVERLSFLKHARGLALIHGPRSSEVVHLNHQNFRN